MPSQTAGRGQVGEHQGQELLSGGATAVEFIPQRGFHGSPPSAFF